jgi:hypothetical protein
LRTSEEYRNRRKPFESWADMAWIESHQEIGRHPKTVRLARILGIPIPQAVGHLHFLWWWALDYAQDGDLTQFDEYEIAYAVMWDKEPKAIIDALVTSRFLDADDNGLFIHDFDEYVGRLIEKREQSKDRNRRARQKSAAPAQQACNERVTDAPTVQYLTVQNTTEPKEKESRTGACARAGARARARPPTLTAPTAGEVAEYCREKGFSLDAQRFVDFYASKGWMVGKNPMKDWRAAARNWSSRDKGGIDNGYARPNTNPGYGPGSIFKDYSGEGW